MSLYLYMESKKRFGPSGAQIFQAAFASGCECVACKVAFLCLFFRFSEGVSRENSVARRRSLLSRLLMTRVLTLSFRAKSLCLEIPAQRQA